MSSLMALIANVNNTKRGKSYNAAQFNPTVSANEKRNRRKVLPYSAETMSMAKAFFTSMSKHKNTGR